MTIFFNHCFDKRRFRSFLLWFFKKNRHIRLLKFLEKLKFLGFHSATETGFSVSIDDLQIPSSKSGLLLTAENKVLEADHQFSAGYLTMIERYQQIIEIWSRTNEKFQSIVIQSFQISDLFNPVYLMAFSGARGNISQIQQLVGMRGLMADPQGQIIDFPIRSNFREGLTLTEYLICCSGARKGIVDTALRTAASGYLTRRLVDVAHHVIISQIDCRVEKGIWLEDLYDKKKKILPLQQRLIGRVLAESIATFPQNQEISKRTSQKICQYRQKVLVRSPLTCQSAKFICQLCYGWNLAEGQFVSIGEAVGVLAAQSIGEPGTQLTMRTFHTGGVFTGTLIEQTYSPFSGIVHYPISIDGFLIRTPQGQIAYLSQENGHLKINGPFNGPEHRSFPIQNSTLLYVRQGEHVTRSQLIAEFPDFDRPFQYQQQEVFSPFSGEIYFENLLFLEKTTSDFKLIPDLGKFWILFGKSFNIDTDSFFRKQDLVTGSVPFLQITIPKARRLHRDVFLFFKKIGYFKSTQSFSRNLYMAKNSISLLSFQNLNIFKNFGIRLRPLRHRFFFPPTFPPTFVQKSRSLNRQKIKENQIRFFLSFSSKSEIFSLTHSFFFTDISDFFSRSRESIKSPLGSLDSGQSIGQTQALQVYRKGATYLLNHPSILHVQHGQIILKNQKLSSLFLRQSKTGDIVQGIPRIEEIFEARTRTFDSNIENLQKSVVNDIQKIYCGQGVHISDKHIEIIVRQMTSNAIILQPGATGLLCGEIVPYQWISRLPNVLYQPIFMGMTKTCLQTSSFISAASFQETTRVLSQAALQNQMDFLRGLKQNVILGNLIPIGTGCF